MTEATSIHQPAAPHPRILLCASAAHCARILQAAALARIDLHGLEPCTCWPTSDRPDAVVLWALLADDDKDIPALHTEQLWRTHMLQGNAPFAIHMLYGNATQQSQQLVPWIAMHHGDGNQNSNPCWECLDAASEQKLFQHLLNRS